MGTRDFAYGCDNFDWRIFGLANQSPCSFGHVNVAAEFPAFPRRGDAGVEERLRDGVPCLVAMTRHPAVDESV